MKIKIEKNIPIPPGASSRTTGLMEALMAMQVGDSFTYPLHKRGSVTGTVTQGKQRGMIGKRRAYMTRRASQTLIRVWRTK